MRLLLVLFAVSLWVGCDDRKKEAPAAETGKLLSEVKTALAERDRKLQAYELHGSTTEQGQLAVFRFFYRSPHFLRGVLEKPVARTFSYDGQTLYQLDGAAKKLAVISLDVPEPKAKLFLTQLFGAFVPEGYRAPLLLSDGVTAKRAVHARAKDAVEVRQQTTDESGQPIAVTYVFRWPAMDFLEKRSEVGGNETGRVTVEEEHCDEALKLCVPKRVAQGAALTVLDEVKLNPSIPQDSFTLSAPEGFQTEKRSVGGAGQ